MWAGSKVQMKVVLLVQLKVFELVVKMVATTAEKKVGLKVVEKAVRKDYWTAESTDDKKESVMVELLDKQMVAEMVVEMVVQMAVQKVALMAVEMAAKMAEKKVEMRAEMKAGSTVEWMDYPSADLTADWKVDLMVAMKVGPMVVRMVVVMVHLRAEPKEAK